MKQEHHLSVPYDTIAQQLGLQANDCLMIASDVTRLALAAKKEGTAFSADRFVDSFLTVLSEGTLLIPAYSDYLKNGQTFDWKTAKPSTGALSNKIMRRADFLRTKDPLHSVFVKGVDTPHISRLKDISTFGENSIFGYMERKGAKMLIIDVAFQNSFTYIHYLEEKWQVKYRQKFTWNLVVNDGEQTKKREFHFYAKKLGILTDLEKYEAFLLESGVTKRFYYGEIPMTLVSLDQIETATKEFLKKGGKLYRFSFPFMLKTIAKRLLNK
jgi:aminoglycoside 3-N-acetyltransferase